MERMSAAQFQERYGGKNKAVPSRTPHPKPAKQTGALGKNNAVKTPLSRRPLVRFILCRVQLLDADAKWGSVKDLLDGLQYAGLIHGDREDQIRLKVEQQKVAHYDEEETIIEIEYP